MTHDTVRAAAAVLRMHQRMEGISGNCMCGQLRLGDSHSEHLARMLDGAGLLRDHVVKAVGE